MRLGSTRRVAALARCGGGRLHTPRALPSLARLGSRELSTDADHVARLQTCLPAVFDESHFLFEPVWADIARAVAASVASPGVIVDLASGAAEPACTLSRAFPHAEVVASDSEARGRGFTGVDKEKQVGTELLAALKEAADLEGVTVDELTAALPVLEYERFS